MDGEAEDHPAPLVDEAEADVRAFRALAHSGEAEMPGFRTERMRRVERLAVVRDRKREAVRRGIARNDDRAALPVLDRVRYRLADDEHDLGEHGLGEMVWKPAEMRPDRHDARTRKLPGEFREHLLRTLREERVAAHVEDARTHLVLRVRENPVGLRHRLRDLLGDVRRERNGGVENHAHARELLLERVVEIRGHALALVRKQREGALLRAEP